MSTPQNNLGVSQMNAFLKIYIYKGSIEKIRNRKIEYVEHLLFSTILL